MDNRQLMQLLQQQMTGAQQRADKSNERIDAIRNSQFENSNLLAQQLKQKLENRPQLSTFSQLDFSGAAEALTPGGSKFVGKPRMTQADVDRDLNNQATNLVNSQTGIQNTLKGDQTRSDRMLREALNRQQQQSAMENSFQKLKISQSQKGSDRQDKIAMQLFGKVEGDKTIKDFREITSQFDRIQNIAKRSDFKTGANDLGLIFSFMKTLDPGSTVREGEFANAENAGGIEAKWRNLFNKVRTGQRLTEAQRREIVRVAALNASSAKKSADVVINRYSDAARRFGVDPSLVIGNGLKLSDEVRMATGDNFEDSVVSGRAQRQAPIKETFEQKKARARRIQESMMKGK